MGPRDDQVSGGFWRSRGKPEIHCGVVVRGRPYPHFDTFYNPNKPDKAEIVIDWLVKNNPDYAKMWGALYNRFSRMEDDELEWMWHLYHKKHNLSFYDWKQKFKQ